MPHTLIILHIPKTAGTTLRTIAAQQVPHDRFAPLYAKNDRQMTRDGFATLPDQAKRNYQMLMGHFSFGLHRHLPPGQEWSYATMVRDPVKRARSQYNVLANSGRPESRARLDNFLRGDSARAFDNRQVKMLSGMRAPRSGVTEDMLKAAIANVEKHFAWVGVTERFEESLYLAGKTLGWKISAYEDRNRAAQRSIKTVIPESDAARLVELNALDRKLYDYVNRRLDESLQAQGDRYPEELAEFRRHLQELRDQEPPGEAQLGRDRRGRRANPVSAPAEPMLQKLRLWKRRAK